MRKLFRGVCVVALLMGLGTARGQVTISPTTLFVDGQSQFQTFIVMNGTNVSQEVSLDYQFGYPDADSLGNIFINYDDPVRETEYSIVNWIRGYPRNFVIKPGQRRVVRLTVRPNVNLPDGMYWARIKTRSAPVSPEIGVQPDNAITTKITVQFEQVIAVFYQVGEVRTGLDLRDVDVSTDQGVAVMKARVERLGNAPYLGTVTMRVFDANNQPVGEVRNLVSIYFDRMLKMQFDASQLPAGEYRSEITFQSTRSDIAERHLIPSRPITRSVNFSIR